MRTQCNVSNVGVCRFLLKLTGSSVLWVTVLCVCVYVCACACMCVARQCPSDS